MLCVYRSNKQPQRSSLLRDRRCDGGCPTCLNICHSALTSIYGLMFLDRLNVQLRRVLLARQIAFFSWLHGAANYFAILSPLARVVINTDKKYGNGPSYRSSFFAIHLPSETKNRSQQSIGLLD